jgi:hypothetical protein
MDEPDFIPPYEGWAPYCLVCSTMLRMKPTDYGWQCRACGNPINRRLTHYTPEPRATPTTSPAEKGTP